MGVKIELGALLATALGAAGVMTTAGPLEAQQPLERTAHFSSHDIEAFDRDFQTDGTPCSVGIAKHRLCFNASPLQARLTKGEPLDRAIPIMAAELQILVALPAKGEHQKLLRYGTSLVLLNKETHLIEDILDLETAITV